MHSAKHSVSESRPDSGGDALLARVRCEQERLIRLLEERQREILDSRRFRLLAALTRWLHRPTARPWTMPAPVAAPRREVRVAAILDEFSAHGFAPEWRQELLLRPTWRAQVERFGPQLLFVEAAWAGPGETWRREVEMASVAPQRTLQELIGWCRSNHVPTVFWAKEDPPNLARFLGAAAMFDRVFTTDAESVPLYGAMLGHDRVDVLPFAAQPALHAPSPPHEERRRRVAFAGSWMAEKYPDRAQQLAILLAGAEPLGLDIFDRNHRRPGAFPERYAHLVRGGLSYPDMLAAYRRYRVFLNVSSVTDSSTMMPRRVFEVLASGACVISTPSRAIEKTFPPGIVHVVRDEIEARAAITRALEDDAWFAESTARARTLVLAEHTYERRVRSVLRASGLD